MAHAHNRKSSQPRERKSVLGNKRTGAKRAVFPACMCVHYESSEEDDTIGMGACHCGHSPEEHTFAGCEGEVRP